eukprot:gene9671-8494_t
MGCGSSTANAGQEVLSVVPKEPTSPLAPGTHVQESTSALAAKAVGRAVVTHAVSTVSKGEPPSWFESVAEDGEELSCKMAAAQAQAESAVNELKTGDVSGVEALVDTLLSDFVSAIDAERGAVNIQLVKLPSEYSKAEEALKKYSAFGHVLVSVTQHAVATLPFGEPVAAMIGLIYSRAAQAAHNTKGATRLLINIKRIDRCLARVTSNSSTTPNEDLQASLRRLPEILQRAAVVLSAYTGRGFFKRFLLSTHDEEQFKQLTDDISDAMHAISFSVAVDNLGHNVGEPDVKELRQAMLLAAGMPADTEWTSEKADEEHGKLEPRLIVSELRALEERLGKLEATVDTMRAELTQVQMLLKHVGLDGLTKEDIHRLQAATKDMSPPGLKAYLSVWWQELFRRLRQVPSKTLLAKLSEWMRDNGFEDKLQEYDADLEAEGFALSSLASDPTVGGVFLETIFLQLVNENGDDFVSRDELLGGQIKAEKFAQEQSDVPLPTDWLSFLDAMYVGFDRRMLASQLGQTAGNASQPWPANTNLAEVLLELDGMMQLLASQPSPANTNLAEVLLELEGMMQLLASQPWPANINLEEILLELEGIMQVKPIIQSYNVTRLLGDYVEGTRGWLYDDVNKWLAAAMTSGCDLASSRAYLLLGDPGMGKSVFSAVLHTRLISPSVKGGPILVKHFFKVGEKRAQATSMVLSLAFQLAEKLPGMAELLVSVAKEHGTGDGLLLRDLFDRFMLQPLLKLEADTLPGSLPVMVFLLDALDEADHSGSGWMPVTRLVAKEFSTLPASIKLILTSRPQTAVPFAALSPHIIEPQAKDNMEDVRKLLTARVRACGRVKPASVTEAVEILQRKSKGQLIYTKYVLDYMAYKDVWTVSELEAGLPEGLGGAYTLILTIVTSALQKGGNGPELLKLLIEKVLPVLAAARDPLTPQLLAWACGCPLWSSNGEVVANNECGDGTHQPTEYVSGIRGQVDELLDLLFNIFPTRAVTSAAKPTLVIQPYHKSVLDWLLCSEGMDSGVFRVDATVGHLLLGHAGELYCQKELAMLPGREVVPPELCNMYALRHTLAHLCQVVASSQSAIAAHPMAMSPEVAALERLLLNFGMWQHVYSAKFGPSVFRDLLSSGIANHVVQDVIRWLQLCSWLLNKYPQAALQLAVDAPSNSLVAKAAGELLCKPQGLLMSPKDTDWSLNMSTLIGHKGPVRGVAFSNDVTAILSGHTNRVTSVAISTDGMTIVSGSAEDDKSVRVWDLETAMEKHKLEGHTKSVTIVAISTDGKTIVSGSCDYTVRVWDLDTGVEKHKLEGHTNGVFGVAISMDGKTIVSGSVDKTLEGHTDGVMSVAISTDGKTIASGSRDGTVRVWDLDRGVEKLKLEGHLDGVEIVAISMDGKTIVSGSMDETVRLWDLETCIQRGIPTAGRLSQPPEKIVKYPEMYTDTFYNLGISPDGRSLVTAGLRSARLWDLDTGSERYPLQIPERYSNGFTNGEVTISPDGKTIVGKNLLGNYGNGDCYWSMDNGRLTSNVSVACYSILGRLITGSTSVGCDATKSVISFNTDETKQVVRILSGNQLVSTIYIRPSVMVGWQILVTADKLVALTTDYKLLVYNINT